MALGYKKDDGFQAGCIQVDESGNALVPPSHPPSPAPEGAVSAHINNAPSPSVAGMSSADCSGAADRNVASLSTGEPFSRCFFAAICLCALEIATILGGILFLIFQVATHFSSSHQ